MAEEPVASLREWMRRIQQFRAGIAGHAVVATTLLATAFLAFNPHLLLPPGKYPRFVLMIPPLAIGAAVFFALAVLTWLPRRRR